MNHDSLNLCNSNKKKISKGEKSKEIVKQLGLKTPLSKVPTFGNIFFGWFGLNIIMDKGCFNVNLFV